MPSQVGQPIPFLIRGTDTGCALSQRPTQVCRTTQLLLCVMHCFKAFGIRHTLCPFSRLQSDFISGTYFLLFLYRLSSPSHLLTAPPHKLWATLLWGAEQSYHEHLFHPTNLRRWEQKWTLVWLEKKKMVSRGRKTAEGESCKIWKRQG